MESSTSAVAAPVVPDVAALHTEVRRLSSILAQFDKEPPPLPEGEALSIRVAALEGRINTHESRLNAHDGLHDALSQIASRLAMCEQAAGVAAIPMPRDMEHETRQVTESMKCDQCLTVIPRTINAAQTNAQEIPCPVCNGVMKVAASEG